MYNVKWLMTGTFFFSRPWRGKKDPAGYETNGHRRRRHSVVESSESYDASLFIIYLLFFFFNIVWLI